MKKIAILFLLPLSAFALDDTYKVTEVLSGDTGVFTDSRGTTTGYFHLAGCIADSLENHVGKDEKIALAHLVLNQQVTIRFFSAEKKNLTADDINGKHTLAQIHVGSQDVCAELVKVGMSSYNIKDEPIITSVQSSAIRNFQQIAQNKRLGRWKDAVVGKFVPTPDSNNALERYQYKQQYVNGATDPSKTDFDRNKANAKSSPPPSGDWRKKIGNE